MNPQTNTNARINQVLNALRTTEPPAGLEARIAARLSQARTQPTASSSFFAVFLRAVKTPSLSLAPANFVLSATAALTLLIALSTLTLLHSRATLTTPSQSFADHSPSPSRTAQPSPAFAFTNAPSTKISLTKHAARQSPPAPLPPSAQDPDQLALAETLAPSLAAPLPPLTAQEKTLVAATRPGEPMQLAELDRARAPILRAIIEAREAARINRYVRQSLAPLAVADALSPTTDSPPQEAATPPPPPLPSQN